MEIWDAYDQDEQKLGFDLVRDEPVAKGVYHVVVEIYTVTQDKEILVTQRHHNKTYPLYWEVTGGSILKNETPLLGALRELKEETGIKVDEEGMIPIYTQRYSKYHTIFKGFMTVIDKNKVTIKLQDQETIDYKWIPFHQYKQFMKTQKFIRFIRKRYMANQELIDGLIENI